MIIYLIRYELGIPQTTDVNRDQIDIVQKYIRGDATRMETYIEIGALVHEHQSCKGILAQRMLTPIAIQSMHSDYFDLPDDTRIDSSPKASNQKIKLLEEVVTIDDSEQSLLGFQAITDLEFGGNGCPMHQPEGPTHV